jgi:hypothetical protein
VLARFGHRPKCRTVALRASVCSTEAAKDVVARVGVNGYPVESRSNRDLDSTIRQASMENICVGRGTGPRPAQ